MSEIGPIQSIDEFYKEKNPFLQGDGRKPIDSRIQGVVSQINKAAPSTLLASATSPRIVIDLIGVPVYPIERPKKRPVKKREGGKRMPIGLLQCPLNAMLQLILFLPTFRDVFSFAPRSFQLLSDFIDQYAIDQESNLPVCSFHPNQLYRLLIQKISCQPSVQFLQALTKSVHAPLVIHDITWDMSLPFSCSVDLPSRPSELFVTIKNKNESACHLIQRQFFTKPDSYCYDLDAFIEYRPDGNRGDTILYLKSEGAWVQCDDERITPMRSTQLNMPLYRSILLHYKRIWPK